MGKYLRDCSIVLGSKASSAPQKALFGMSILKNELASGSFHPTSHPSMTLTFLIQ